MTTLNIKIVGVEGDSVLVKYASENSAKPIDEYEAVAYQPKAMGYYTLNDFIEGIKPGLLPQVIARDNLEKTPAPKELDLSNWQGQEVRYTVVPENVSNVVPDALDSQVIVKQAEVIL